MTHHRRFSILNPTQAGNPGRFALFSRSRNLERVSLKLQHDIRLQCARRGDTQVAIFIHLHRFQSHRNAGRRRMGHNLSPYHRLTTLAHMTPDLHGLNGILRRKHHVSLCGSRAEIKQIGFQRIIRHDADILRVGT